MIAASLPHNGNLFLRWSGADIGGSGARDRFGLDNVDIATVPEPSTLALHLGTVHDFHVGFARCRSPSATTSTKRAVSAVG